MFSSPVVVLATISLLYLIFQHITDKRKLPPGPRPFPLVGNIRDFPPADVPEYKHWLKHKDLYGPISSVSVMGTTLILIHDRAMAHDLLENAGHGAKTAGRHEMTMAGKLCGFEFIVLCQGNTPLFRHYRKLLHKQIGTKVTAGRYRDTQQAEVGRQLVRALRAPESWTTGATTLKTTYDYTVEPEKPDALVGHVEKMLASFSEAAVPMAWPVDIIPALQYIPENFPGVVFKKTARRLRKQIMDGAYVPYQFVKDQMAKAREGEEHSSVVSKLIRQCTAEGAEKNTLSPEDEHAIIWASASLYGAAADTTVITLTAWTYAMIQFPEVQRKAQEEIDRVVGTERLPTFDDRPDLPYIDAVIKEALRWWPIACMGFPHTADVDIEYKGYHIPKGAMLLPAVWWFMHDPDVYPNPDQFEPERFLSPRNEPDPMEDVFGYGRRRCPGVFLADNGLFTNMAQSLACFKMEKAVGEDGKDIEVDLSSNPGILHYATKSPLKITPRSERHVEMIERIGAELPEDQQGDSHLLNFGG